MSEAVGHGLCRNQYAKPDAQLKRPQQGPFAGGHDDPMKYIASLMQ